MRILAPPACRPRAADPLLTAPAAERMLADALDRAMRAPRGRAVLVLHLSRLARPAPQPHHSRVARALLEDAAQRHDGLIFPLSNGDIALLCRRTGLAGDAAGLPAILLRLFRTELADAAELLSLWCLEESTAAVRDWLAARMADPEAPPVSRPAALVAATAAPRRPAAPPIGAILDSTPIVDLVQRQAAALVVPGQAALRPLFREVTLAVAVLDARLAAVGSASLDPLLIRHVAARLDGRILDLLTREVAAGGPPAGPALHLNLSLPGVLADGFAEFAGACRRRGMAAGIELSLVEICADHEAFAAARERVRAAGLKLVIDEIGPLGLLLIDAAALGADLVKLDWSPRLPGAPAAERAGMAAAIARLGPGRLVLQRAETERAITWGLQHGIRRFQGRQVDAMLAAGRMTSCAYAGGCSLGQCIERAAATAPAARRFCRNPGLLDGAMLPALVPA